MATIPLTDLAIQKLKADGTQSLYFDTNLPNFGIRVSPKGTKAFVVKYGERRTLKTLGRYPEMTLKTARAVCKAFLAEDTQDDSLEHTPYLEAIVPYIERTRVRIKKETANTYAMYLMQMGFRKNVGEITKRDVTQALSRWDGKPWAQNYAHSVLRAFFNDCLDQELIAKHPMIRSKAPNKTKARARVLSDEEIGRVWRCTGDNTYGRILRLLILTGQRRVEVRNIKPEDIRDGLIIFHTKGDRTNTIPITPLMKPDLKHIPFTFNNWSTAKDLFDNECGVSFRHHDLRRTLATKLAELGTDVVVVERILGHAFGGVKGIYNRHSYIPQMKEALLLYEKHIRKIIRA